MFTKFSRVKLDNFYVNFWDWTGTLVSDGPMKPKFQSLCQARRPSGPQFLFLTGRFCPPLVARLQEAEIAQMQSAGKSGAAGLGENRRSHPSNRLSWVTRLPPTLPSPVGDGFFNRPDQSHTHFRGRSQRAGRGWIGEQREAGSAPAALWLAAAARGRGAGPPAGRGGRWGQAGGRTAAQARNGAGSAAAVKHGRRRSTMRQPVDPG